MGTERTLATSQFPDDDGRASELTRTALTLAAAASTPDDYLRAIVSLCADRVLVPVVATATKLSPGNTQPGANPLARSEAPSIDKEAEMSVVLLQTGDGRRAMLAFTGMDSLRMWDAAARPVPVTLDLAAKSAYSDGAAALLIDFAGPHPLVIDGDVLAGLAQGHRLVELPDGQFGWAIVSHPPD